MAAPAYQQARLALAARLFAAFTVDRHRQKPRSGGFTDAARPRKQVRMTDTIPREGRLKGRFDVFLTDHLGKGNGPRTLVDSRHKTLMLSLEQSCSEDLGVARGSNSPGFVRTPRLP